MIRITGEFFCRVIEPHKQEIAVWLQYNLRLLAEMMARFQTTFKEKLCVIVGKKFADGINPCQTLQTG